MVVVFGVGIVTSSAMAANKVGNTAQQIVKQNCGGCHGIQGNSVIPAYPKLAAQIPHYIRGQLQDFAAGARTSPVMSGIAKALTDVQIKELAQYFSQQTNKNTVHPDAQLVTQGEKIFHGGVSATHIPACAACHGPAAIGLPPLFPRLAGQNAPYIESQLQAFRGKKRSNDPNAMMRGIAASLTDKEIKAVAAYLGSLP